jgi:hypothetical protein
MDGLMDFGYARCRKEFKEHKADDLVTTEHWDVLKDGFQLENWLIDWLVDFHHLY